MKQLPPPVIPNWHPRRELSRPSAEQLSRAENRKQTLTYAGAGEVIPIVYGEQLVSGPIIAGPAIDPQGNLMFAVALCYAGGQGVERIEDVRLGSTVVPLGSISNINSGASANIEGVSVRVLDGRQTAVPTGQRSMPYAIPGFDDAFQGIAYAIIITSAAGVSAATSLAFRVKGRKVVDPRLGAGSAPAYTENPALHMRDFVTDTEFGMGLQLIGGEAAADACDSLYAGSPRARTGLCIQDQMTAEDALALFSTYAEVMYSFDGRNVSVIPDMVAGTIHDIDASTVREGSIDLSTAGLHEIPTLVRVNFRDATDPQWSSRPAVARMPGGPVHGAAQAPSDVPLPGVYRRAEAERRAAQRLLRLQAPGRIRWQMFAPGLPFQAGDVVRMPDVRGVGSIRVRLTSQPEMVAPLLYQLGGEIYDESHYPQSAEGVALPQGAIVPYISSSVPKGHVGWSASGFIMGHATGGQQLPGSTGSISFTLEEAGGHFGRWLDSADWLSLGAPTVGYQVPYDGTPPMAGQHAHGLSVQHTQILQALPVEQVRWCKRTAEALDVEDGIAVLADRALSSTRLHPRAGISGRYLAAGNPLSRNRSQSTSGVTGNGGAHFHSRTAELWSFKEQPIGSGYVHIWDGGLTGNGTGSHTHSYSCPVSATLKSKRLAMYVSSGEALLPAGSIVGWEDGAPPEGWHLCDGSNGTIDLRDHFIELSAPDHAGETASDTTTTTVGPPSVASHRWNHGHKKYLPRGDSAGSEEFGTHEAEDHPHTHPVSGGARSVSFMPPRRTLQFIQYTGE